MMEVFKSKAKACCADFNQQIDLHCNLLITGLWKEWIEVGSVTTGKAKLFKFCPWCGRNVNAAKAVYDPNMKMPPRKVSEAAKLVENYFGENHMGDWEFMGLRNRFPKP